VLRELRCEFRTFKTVRGALVWYARYGAGDDDGNDVHVSVSFEQRERNQNTCAMMMLALQPSMPEVDTFTLQHIPKLVEWHCAYVSQRELATDWGFPSLYALRKTMQWTENVLENRLRVRGLLA
jgi:hypothetical protein